MTRRLLAALALLPLPAFAQEAPPPPDEDDRNAIVVTGRGLDSGDAVARSAVSTIVVISREGGTASGRFEDMLRDVPGLAQFRRSDSRSAHPTSQGVTMRGLGGNAASRMVVLVDDVPQADPFGGWVAFPAYMPDRFARAVIVHGGGAPLSMPGALAGTISLESAGPGELGRLRLAVDGGSRDSLDARLLGSARLGEGFVTLAAGYARGDGFVPIVAEDRGPVDRAAPYDQASLALRGVFPVGAETELQASVSGFRDRRDRGVDYTQVASDGVDASVRLVGNGAWKWSALAYVQDRAFASGFASVNDARTSVSPTLNQYNVPSIGIGGRIEVDPPLGADATLRLGAEARRVSGRTQELYTYVAGAPTRRRVAGGDSTTVGAFADAHVERGDWSFTGGARLDRWRIGTGSLVERALAGGPALTDLAFAPRSGWEGAGRLGVSVNPVESVILRVLGYRDWRLPTLNELYRPFRVGADATAANPDLAPERLWGAEAGIDIEPANGISFHATGYWNRLGGAIANVTLANGPGTFPGVGFVSAAGVYRQRRNLDAIRVAGLELMAEVHRGAWSANLGWLIADPRVEASGAAAALDGLRPAQTPLHTGTATIGWHRGDWAASATVRYTGRQYEDDQNSRALADALTFDAVLQLPLGAGFGLSARAENIFDARVEAGISGANLVERATPRTLWLGLRYRMR